MQQARAELTAARRCEVCCADARLGNAGLALVALSRQRRSLSHAVRDLCRGSLSDDDTLVARLIRIRSTDELACSRKAVEIAERGDERRTEAIGSGKNAAGHVVCGPSNSAWHGAGPTPTHDGDGRPIWQPVFIRIAHRPSAGR